MAAPHGDFELVGADGSPYSCKMRAVMRYRRIPFRWVRSFGMMQGSGGDMWTERFPEIRAKVIPVLVRPDGTYGNDSTPLVQDLERLVPDPERSVNPAHEGDRFLSLLLEDFADEWCTKVMFAGRFKAPEDATFGASWQVLQDPRAASAGVDAEVFATRQRGRRNLVGALEWAPMERTLREICRILTEMVQNGQAFLFGDLPSVADFALYGQLRQTIQDPLPAQIMYEYPAAWAWVWRVDDLSGYEPGMNASRAHARSDVTSAVTALLRLASQTYFPFLEANAQALQTDAKTVEVAIFDGAFAHVQPPFKYQLRCLKQLRAAYAELAPEHKEYCAKAIPDMGFLASTAGPKANL